MSALMDVRSIGIVRFLVSLMVLVGLAACSVGQTNQTTRVERIIDGDTIVIDSGDRIRLLGVDCPERSEQGGRRATTRIARLLPLGSRIILVGTERDYWKRRLAYIEIETDHQEDVGLTLIEEGYCDHFTRYRHPRFKSYEIATRLRLNRHAPKVKSPY